MWFFFALGSMVLWGAADLFYKKGAGGSRYSHLWTSVMVGAVMGVHAVCMLLFTDMGYDPVNLLIYMPVSAMYILSMTVGYFGLKYLELSISSPVQNSSGAVVCVLCLIFLGQKLDGLSAAAVALICAGMLILGVLERNADKKVPAPPEDKRYVSGLRAFLIPIAYCVIDALGTFLDAYYLDDIAATPLRNVTEETFENVANTSYELTFFAVAVLLFLWLTLVKKEKPAVPRQGSRLLAAVFETAGQFTYVYAMSGSAVVAAPMVAAYSMVSVLLSRVFLGEKLTGKQYAAVAAVMAGIILLGVAEGLAS